MIYFTCGDWEPPIVPDIDETPEPVDEEDEEEIVEPDQGADEVIPDPEPVVVDPVNPVDVDDEEKDEDENEWPIDEDTKDPVDNTIIEIIDEITDPTPSVEIVNRVTQEVTESDDDTIVFGLDFTKSMLLFIAAFILLLSVTILIYRSCRKYCCQKSEVIKKPKEEDKKAE